MLGDTTIADVQYLASVQTEQIKLAGGGTVDYSCDDDGALRSIRYGDEYSLTYSDDQTAVRFADGTGEHLNIRARETGDGGNSFTFSFGDGVTESFIYDENGVLSSATDGAGRTTGYIAKNGVYGIHYPDGL